MRKVGPSYRGRGVGEEMIEAAPDVEKRDHVPSSSSPVFREPGGNGLPLEINQPATSFMALSLYRLPVLSAHSRSPSKNSTDGSPLVGNAAWSQTMVAGSNMGELFGAMFVFFSTRMVLNSLRPITFWHPPQHQVAQDSVVSAVFVPISFGYVAGDVSLVADIQSQLQATKHKDELPASASGETRRSGLQFLPGS
ncbi:hypothetical protein LZ554_006004 [Drepanopeziza brunnea f. sp. 'monogermtubi']|nr:hypothetical protein LZ554_006004 [Drepanopeziza brunnea f. sp. 'monogermtubi']